MKSITIFHRDRKIILRENTPELEINVDNSEIEEPFKHKCNNRMETILDTFLENDEIKEISFEHDDFEKLFNDFKSQFKYIEAAGGLVRDFDNKLLIIQRFGIPDFPKGKIEKGESPSEAALREVSEECGINDLKILDEAQSSYHIYRLGDKKILKKTFWFHMEYKGIEKPIPQKEESITKVEWCNKQLLNDYKNKTYKSLQIYFDLT